MNKRGFTLVELLVVISIVGTLAAVLFPLFARARESARRASCASNLEQLGMALNMYAQSYDGRFPRKNNDYAALYPFVRNEDIFWCPSDSSQTDWRFKGVPPGAGRDSLFDSPRGIAVKAYSSYFIRGGLSNESRADTVMAGEGQVFHSSLVNVLYAGGHVRALPGEGYVPLLKPPPVESEAPPAAPAGTPPPSGAKPSG